MQHDPQIGFSAFPTEALFEFSAIEEVKNSNRGEYITAFSERKRVLASILFLDEASFRKAPLITPGQHRKHALTNFFVLSNIRFVSGGSSENVEDLAMYSYQTFPIRRAPDARSERALSL
jgi:hypothetical protein